MMRFGFDAALAPTRIQSVNIENVGPQGRGVA